MRIKKVVVIGAGIGGITTSAYLAQRGYDVTVFEKNRKPGGRCDRIEREGHLFDVGPTLYVMPEVYQWAFSELGTSAEELLDLQRVDPTYHLHFDDGSSLALTSDIEALCDQIEVIERGSSRGLLRYLEQARKHYKIALEHLVQRNFRNFHDFFNLRNIPVLLQVHALQKHYQGMSKYFKSPRLKAAFTFQDMYMGLSPFEAPSTFSLMQYTEIAHGVWYPRGGMYQIVDALMQIARGSGVRFHFDTPVQQIEVTDGRAAGVLLECGEVIPADVVVANADLPYVYRELLPPNGSQRRMARRRYSCSTMSFFWGLKKPYPQLQPHTLFLSDDYRGSFETIIRDLSIPSEPSLYFHAPTRLDPTLAPEGEDTLIGIVPVGHMSSNGHQDWKALKRMARRALLERLTTLGITDLEANLKFEICCAPPSWKKRYNLVKGATHGLSHTLTQMAYLRPHNRHPHHPNLYFVGASTHPGTGVPTVMVSARLVAERIQEEVGAYRN
jgi:phytoene desaturase